MISLTILVIFFGALVVVLFGALQKYQRERYEKLRAMAELMERMSNARKEVKEALINIESKFIGSNIHSVLTLCQSCHRHGTNLPHDYECGNCESADTIRYYDIETIEKVFKDIGDML